MSKTKVRSPSPVTLRQVAKAARVSEMTVSRVMRNADAVSPRTRQTVLNVAEKLGYVPNQIAGALASSSTNLLGVVVPSMTNHVFPEVMAGIHDVLTDSTLQPVFGITNYNVIREEQLIRDMLSWRPSGLIVCGLSQTEYARRLMRGSGIPVVQMMEVDGDPIEYNVGISHHDAGLTMANYLLDKGYRKVAYVGSELEIDIAARKRLAGFNSRLVEHGAGLCDVIAPSSPSSPLLGRELTATLLCRHRGIEAIHYANDNLAVGGMMHCLSDGIAVPQQLALCGFAGLDIAKALPISLTTIASPRREIGQHAARYILKQLQSTSRAVNPPTRSSEVLPFVLQPGQST